MPRRRSLHFVVLLFSLAMFCAAMAIPTPAQTLTTLHSFDSTDGAYPFAGLFQASDGNFYGTTYNGGANNEGTVFKITPSGTLVWVYSFCSKTNCPDGALPVGGLIQYTDGSLYGTAGYGGANNRGTVFKITLSGTLTTLYSFCNLEACADGSQPYAGLILGSDGNFYGTTLFGGKYTYGEIFEITPSGSPTTLYSFCPDKNPCPDGARPSGNLIQGADGRFYGTTQAGGANHNNDCATEGCGTVFAFAGGGLKTLYSFCAQSGCTDGQTPNAGVIQATNGYLYGTTNFGGANNNNGTVFKSTTSGALTSLYSFCSVNGCLDGQGPTAGLLQATDGNLYGTTSAGGSKGAGTIYEMNLSGALATIYTFCSQSGCSDGQDPYAALIQGTDGNFYGTTFGGGAGYGSVFSLSGPAQLVPVTPCRLYDTRYEGSGPIQGGTSQTFDLPSLAELGKWCQPFSLSSAQAYSLNIAVVPQGPLGYLTMWPAGLAQPYVATLNS
ncbi:MAG: choice-of-anchor tandem repeat GloVer-containing protein, partial [Candidatus Korobacteraceae bacterium]